ncbi:MAG: sulfite exporter TauE/SafE family protein [Solitalea sp.]
MDPVDLFFLLLSGCVGGFLAGMLGIGGGIVYVAIFSIYLERLGIPDGLMVPAIVANSMLAILFSSISGTIKHIRKQNFFPAEILGMGIPAALFSVIGTRLIQEGSWYTKERFTIFFILILIYTVIRLFLQRETTGAAKPEKNSTMLNILIGCAGGLLAALSGLGGGIVMIPLMTNLLFFSLKKATTISLGVIVVITLVHSVYSMVTEVGVALEVPYSIGLICLPVVLPVSLGSIVCSPLGVATAFKASGKTLRISFALLILCVIARMVYSLIQI